MIDISQELFTCAVYPGDTSPSRRRVRSIGKGDTCNLTDLTLCAHNGTHLDAPLHFIEGGKSVDEVELSRLMGECLVCSYAQACTLPETSRLLIRGDCPLDEETAKKFAAKYLLVGCESQSVGDEKVHLALLSAEVAVLEGLRLGAAEDGRYELIALPLKLGSCDGAPVRAVLRKSDNVSVKF